MTRPFYWSHWDPTDVSFFVKMEASSFSRYLNLPRKFAKNFREKIFGSVKLKGHSGKVWQVQVLRSDNTLSLRSGWRDFVTANKIDENDLLVFKYSSNSSFDVLIFDPRGCEKAASIVLKNEQTESESESVPETDSESESEKTSSDSDASVRDVTPPEKISSDRVLSSPATHAKKKRERNDEGTSRNAKKAKNTLLDKPYHKPYHVPIRTELSDMQRKIADTMASSTQQGSKLFVKILRSRDFKHQMAIPRRFSRLHLEKRSQPISLQMANEEKIFPAHYWYRKERQFIGHGWNEFAMRHNPKERDLCLFEVKRLHRMLTFVVHVPPRANQQISALCCYFKS